MQPTSSVLRAIVQDEIPQVQVSLSSDVLPVFREYERAMATVLNAYVQPVVSRYIGKLESGLRTRGLQGPLLIMASNGGVFGPQTAAQRAVHMALSGPAAGAIGASYVGRLAGYPDVISIDMGGTSADICLIQEGRPAVTHEGEIGPFPLQIPMTDIHTIGAGGGSIAAVTSLGSLTVGPQSAGAVPGPACYDQGGTAPTVTDANLVLGRIPPALLGGEVPLNLERARQAIHDHVAVPLGLDLYEAAAGIVQIVNNNMVGALRVVSVEKGYDPERFALVAFGGAGPLHAGPLAQLLGTPTILIPPYPGLLSALGLLATDIQHDVMRTFVQRGPQYDLAGMEAVYQALHAEAAAHLAAEGLPPERRSFQRLADLRYARQGFEVTVDFPGEAVSAAAVAPGHPGLSPTARAALHLRRSRYACRNRQPAPARRGADGETHPPPHRHGASRWHDAGPGADTTRSISPARVFAIRRCMRVPRYRQRTWCPGQPLSSNWTPPP